MLRKITILGLIMLLPHYLKAQIIPWEGSTLNYRLIGFSFPSVKDATNNYTLEIAAGNYYSEDSFRKNIIITEHPATNKIITEVPEFGKGYTWRVVYGNNKPLKAKNTLYHFSTGTTKEVDTTLFRLRIINHTEKYKDALVFSDGNKVLYDMNGKPVWYLPLMNKSFPENPCTQDMKLSAQGSITFLMGPDAYDINYNGDILWEGPGNAKASGNDIENYHHEFTKLGNGHYMIFGNELMLCRIPTSPDDNLPIVFNDTIKSDSIKAHYIKMPFGTIIEYDEQGNTIWSWKSSKYFQESDLVNYRPASGAPIIDLHENAFFFDEKDSIIYLSFKNISRIVKIKYPEGTIIDAYGEKYEKNHPASGNNLYCHQHACKRSAATGCVFLFNNNGCNPGMPPKIKKFKESASAHEPLKKIWEYECTIEGNYPKGAPSGGNVMELKDQSLFVSMGGFYSKMFIVTDDKKEVWSAIPEHWIPSQTWTPVMEYRASIIENREDLERLIWNAETNSATLAEENKIRNSRELSSVRHSQP